MKTHLATGRIGGIPVQGGHVSLEQADLSQIVTAVGGVVRETIRGATSLGFLALGGYMLMSYLSSPRAPSEDERKAEERKQKATDEKQRNEVMARELIENPHSPLGGICSVNATDRKFYGFCLNEKLDFTCNGRGYQLDINHVFSFYHLSPRKDFFGEPLGPPPERRQYQIHLIDGSHYENATIDQPLRFATIAGIETLEEAEFPKMLVGIRKYELQALRDVLIKNLHGIRPDMIQSLGSDVVSKYFHLEA